MKKSISGMHGHGMPIETQPIQHKPLHRNGNEMPTKAETMTSVHESKQFPFVIIEQTTIKNEKETKTFRIGLAGSIVSEKTFKSLETAENYISSRPWDLIINLIGKTIEIMQDNEKSQS